MDQIPGEHKGLDLGTIRLAGDDFKTSSAPVKIGRRVYADGIH
jgi:hypothetical protein